MKVVTRISEVREAVGEARSRGLSIGFVPTMGALHEGHLTLVRRAVKETGFAVVSNYVNPTQFGPGEDFERYPRQPEEDNRLCEEAGAALVYAPLTEELYPPGHATWVTVSGISETLEGLARPGHFRGVATVVAKLLNIVQPDRAYFGRKDAQQLAVIRRMVRDLCLPVEVRAVPTVRDADGLALSSRNRYLSPDERRQALVLVEALRRAEQLAREGLADAALIIERVREVLQKNPALQVDYVAAVDPETFLAAHRIEGPTLLAAAVRVGSVRLIDNVLLYPPAAGGAEHEKHEGHEEHEEHEGHEGHGGHGKHGKHGKEGPAE